MKPMTVSVVALASRFTPSIVSFGSATGGAVQMLAAPTSSSRRQRL